jgi:hypothetical protein
MQLLLGRASGIFMGMNKHDPALAIGQEISGRGPVFFDNIVLDNMLESFMELAAEVWTIRDRQAVLEAVLASQGIDAAALIEQHRPEAAEIAARKALREEFVSRLLAGFMRRTDIKETEA